MVGFDARAMCTLPVLAEIAVLGRRKCTGFVLTVFNGRDGVARPANPNLCTLPITAFRVTSPSFFAIWLALRPSAQSFFVGL